MEQFKQDSVVLNQKEVKVSITYLSASYRLKTD